MGLEGLAASAPAQSVGSTDKDKGAGTDSCGLDDFDPLKGASAPAQPASGNSLGLPASIAAAFQGQAAVPQTSSNDSSERLPSGLSKAEQDALTKQVADDAQKLHNKHGGSLDDPFSNM